jgi:hypothetical protein
MVTPELLSYIKAEVAKGKTRAEIHGALLSGGGGWSEDDLSEAFRTIIPMQNIVLPKEKIIEPSPSPTPTPDPSSPPPISFSLPPLHSFSTPSSYSPSPSLLEPTLSPESSFPSHSSRLLLKFLVILIIIGGLGFGFWHYRSSIKNLPSRAENLWATWVKELKGFHFPFLNTSKNVVPSVPVANNTNNVVAQKPVINLTTNCGISLAPKLGVSSTSENNSVLSCLGENAVSCENATGILKDNFFPTIFEIAKTQNSCNFKLSYPADSALVDITGQKLAGQYISCPINIVKAIDNTNPASPKFNAPDKTDLGKYASQIYFYGTLGLFVENNLDQNKISALGCSGGYIQSVIASYNLEKKK